MVGKVVVMLMASVGVAAAQGPSASGDPLPRAPEPTIDAVSPGGAIAISLGGTVASYALVVAGAASDNHAVTAIGALGTLILPSAGRWYAHAPGMSGFAIRGVAVVVGAIGGLVALDGSASSLFGESQGDSDKERLGLTILALSGIAYLGGTIYDIVEAPAEAQDYNARLHNVALVPVVQPHGAGVMLSAQF